MNTSASCGVANPPAAVPIRSRHQFRQFNVHDAARLYRDFLLEHVLHRELHVISLYAEVLYAAVPIGASLDHVAVFAFNVQTSAHPCSCAIVAAGFQ